MRSLRAVKLRDTKSNSGPRLPGAGALWGIATISTLTTP